MEKITKGSSLETVLLSSAGQECQDLHKSILGGQHRYFRYAVERGVFTIRQTGDILMKKED